jgi:hypothetical protein
MMYQKAFSTVRNGLFTIAAVCLLASCQNDELETITTDAETQMASTGEVESNITSLTITGLNTEFVETVDCSTCTFVVAEGTEVVDGQALGLKPGSVICLDKTVRYGNLSFVNVDGTAENPVTIGNCSGLGN